MEQINDLLECRKAKNKTGYHIYDITNKTRDTVDRINGLERPKPNEGYALKNDISLLVYHKDRNCQQHRRKNILRTRLRKKLNRNIRIITNLSGYQILKYFARLSEKN